MLTDRFLENEVQLKINTGGTRAPNQKDTKNRSIVFPIAIQGNIPGVYGCG